MPGPRVYINFSQEFSKAYADDQFVSYDASHNMQAIICYTDQLKL